MMFVLTCFFLRCLCAGCSKELFFLLLCFPEVCLGISKGLHQHLMVKQLGTSVVGNEKNSKTQ